jgi:hypothetical protein
MWGICVSTEEESGHTRLRTYRPADAVPRATTTPEIVPIPVAHATSRGIKMSG